MAQVSDILRNKGSQVHTVSISATALEAVHYMNQHRIGSVVIVEHDCIVGMFTERDVLRRLVEAERRPAEIPVIEVMTREVICCTPDTPLEEASLIMKDRRVRHVPVVDANGRLQGLISIGDLNAWHARDQESRIHHLHEYLYGQA